MNVRMRTMMAAACCVAAAWMLGTLGQSWLHAQPGPGGEAARSTFELHQLAVPNGSRELLRVNAASGESWRFVSNEWRRVPEEGAVGAGDYQVQMLLAPENRFWAVRIDRRSGRVWNLADGRWFPMAEQRVQPTAPHPAP